MHLLSNLQSAITPYTDLWSKKNTSTWVGCVCVTCTNGFLFGKKQHGMTYISTNMLLHTARKPTSMWIIITSMESSPKGLIIALENSQETVYLPGERIDGSLMVCTEHLGDCNTIVSIAVCLRGEAKVTWPISTRYCSFKDSMVCLDVSQTVWRKEDAPSGTLDSGPHVFPFSFLLRVESLPSSVEYECGSISYRVWATISKNKGLVQGPCVQSIPKQITVLSCLPIHNVELSSPVVKEAEKTPCLSSGRVRVIAQLPRAVYCVDSDEIPLRVKVINASNRTAKQIRAKIVRCVVYSGRHELFGQKWKRVEKAVVRLFSAEPVLPTRTFVWQPTPVKVPASERTVEGCNTISVEYYLAVAVSVCPTRSFLDLKLPLVLGSARQCGNNNPTSLQ